mmetsp:Transcript_21584/g.65944  ORF Transcript_21584/g.65944 Transcript_21584/m.65944 type:complete len:442 (-) Transcript_21584:435-1760(-)
MVRVHPPSLRLILARTQNARPHARLTLSLGLLAAARLLVEGVEEFGADGSAGLLLLALEAVAQEVRVPVAPPNALAPAPLALLVEVVEVEGDLLEQYLIARIALVHALQLAEEVTEDLGTLRAVRRWLRAQVVPVEAAEPRVRLDLVDAVPAQAAVRRRHEGQQEVHALGAELLLRRGRDLEELAPAQDLAARHDGLIGVERGVPYEALIHDDAEAPPVAAVVVALLAEHLRRDVVRRAYRAIHEVPLAVRLAPGARRLHDHLRLALSLGRGRRRLGAEVQAARLGHVHLLAEAQVGELEVPVPVQKHVIWLEVAVDILQRVHGGDGEAHLGHVHARLVLGEGVLAHEQRHEVAAREELHDHVQVRIVLEAVLQPHDPGVVRLGEHVALGDDVAHLVLHHHGLLDHALEREDFLGVLLAHQAHLPKGAPPDDHQRREGLRR